MENFLRETSYSITPTYKPPIGDTEASKELGSPKEVLSKMARPTQPAGQVKQSGRDELVWQALLSTPALPLIMLVYLGKMIANAVVGVMSGSTKESPVTPAEDGLKGAKEIVAEFEQAVVKAQTGNKFQELIAMKRKMWDSHTVARNYINALYNVLV